ncbi:hypothetical protein MFUM_930028 [Methylacidiphilum fumariolicum SolV]|uniref:Uncharacterized protein n=2 Tax=Candidatus Methylacidiphilum fumarolicum TaxID=591154 RepID=I0K0U9_METFB|nr:conserved protein of unknown function [Candidatus Methylacidiphilum fumarolicum]CCG93118.1 hypothetical protein MFUM_930028 [Methylacidiphilum fumariolicum SolV]
MLLLVADQFVIAMTYSSLSFLLGCICLVLIDNLYQFISIVLFYSHLS